jgi:hypothetical protein
LQRARRKRLRAERDSSFLRRIGLRGRPLPIHPADGIEIRVLLRPPLDQRELVAQLSPTLDQLPDLQSDRRRRRWLEAHGWFVVEIVMEVTAEFLMKRRS